MLMGQQHGQSSYVAFMGTCEHPAEVLSRPVMDYAEEHYARYFEAPMSMDGKSLSDLQHYALEQTPTPIRP